MVTSWDRFEKVFCLRFRRCGVLFWYGFLLIRFCRTTRKLLFNFPELTLGAITSSAFKVLLSCCQPQDEPEAANRDRTNSCYEAALVRPLVVFLENSVTCILFRCYFPTFLHINFSITVCYLCLRMIYWKLNLASFVLRSVAPTFGQAEGVFGRNN